MILNNRFRHKKILFGVLNWGLGHATRSSVLIQELLQSGNEVIIYSDGQAERYLKKRFKELSFISAPSYNIHYDSSGKQLKWTLFKQIPEVLKAIENEQQQVEHLVMDLAFDLILSDNRYGCYSSSIPSIFMGHQFKLREGGLFRPLVNKIHLRWINKFDEVFIFDDPKHKGAGQLSDAGQINLPKTYLGQVSALQICPENPEIDVLIMLSGIEAQRQRLECFFTGVGWPEDKRQVLVRGSLYKPASQIEASHLEIVDFASPEALSSLISKSSAVVLRSGYSSLMDLDDFQGKKLLIPTPGQGEQEYLAKYKSETEAQTKSYKEEDLQGVDWLKFLYQE